MARERWHPGQTWHPACDLAIEKNKELASQRSERVSALPEPGGEAGADIPSLVQEVRPDRRGTAVVQQRLQRGG